ncbi:MAG: LamG-like jellyroll fold domain-containing protein [Thermoguttaceae bacterium]|jgi:hypothetical protein
MFHSISFRTHRKISATRPFLLLAASLFGLFLFSLGRAPAQLPPSIHRIRPFDTEIDGPYPTEELDSFFVPSVAPAFASAWNTCGKSLVLKENNLLSVRPMTLLAFVKLDRTDRYNVLFAYDVKSSPNHWELYTGPQGGAPSLYIPGNSVETMTADTDLADGTWHYLGLVMTETSVELYDNGKQVLRGTLDRTPSPVENGIGCSVGIGVTAEQSIDSACKIDELLLRAGLPENEYTPEVIPDQPFTPDEKTLLLCHFDGNQAPEDFHALFDSLIAPREGLAKKAEGISYEEILDRFPSAVLPIEGKLAEPNRGQARITVGAKILEHLFPTGGTEIAVAPTEKPVKNIEMFPCSPERFDAETHRLGITSVRSDDFRPGIFSFWGEQYVELSKQISGQMPLPRGAADQVFDQETLVRPEERYPVQIALRRAQDILDDLDLTGTGPLAPIVADLEKIGASIRDELKQEDPDTDRLATDFFLTAALRRNLMLANPALDDLTKILFLARGCYSGSRLTNKSNSDRIGGHFATQIYGFNSIPGGGLFVLSDWRNKEPQVENLLAGVTVEATEHCSRLAGKELDTGSFYKPEVSYDGKTVYFSHTGSTRHRWSWTPDTTWNIFRLDLPTETEAALLTQLTDSSYNDFDVCELPSGRLVFASERRGGFIRCFTENAGLRVTTSVLHTMKPDGTDIYPLSFFETSEWRPSVDNNGMLLYTRWDYTDRENCLGSTYWTCFPDGRNPRSPHGNYPQPWFTFEDNTHGDHRWGSCPDAPSGLPMTELQFRAIPDSHRLIFTAAPHHGETFGSLCMLDLRVPDDNHMARIRRLTPYFPFPESEAPGRGQYCYGSPWPISEDLYLCNRWEDLILLDRYGNEELLCEREILPIGYDPRLRLSEPIPLAPRPKPPVIPQQTTQGEDFTDQPQTSTVGVINVNIADLPLPENRVPKRLRVIQVIPKPNPWMDDPWIGYATENTPRIPLGTVPIEEDGSVYFEAPSGKQLLFQILDEKNMAIQTMRAVTFVHPGENLLCIGCHEPLDISLENELQKVTPTAFTRPASKLEPECGPVEPMNFYRRVKPMLEKSCLPCHLEQNVEPMSSDHEALRPYAYYFSGGMRGETLTRGPHGGSRSRPGRVGASESKLGTILFDETHLSAVSEEDRHALILWLDANAPRLGAFHDEEAQMQGRLVWPLLDTEPCDLYTPISEPEKDETPAL